MELLKLSRFKLQLRALITEVHQLKERERSANEQLQLTIQKQKQAEEEFSGKRTELQAELDSSSELRRKLERKVGCLEAEIGMLENQEKGLKETISNLLQSKECFVKAYEHSFGEMRQVIEARDRRIQFLSEKVKSHLLLVEAIEKEVSSINNIVENADSALKEREEVVAVLKRKADVPTDLEKLFIEKINILESKLRNNEEELTRKDKVILNLEARLDAEKFGEKSQSRACQIQKDLSDKEILMQTLISEKKALLFEVANSGFVMKKVQDAVSCMDEQNKKAISLFLEGQEKGLTIMEHGLDSCFKDVQRTEVGHVTSSGENNTLDAQETGGNHISDIDNAALVTFRGPRTEDDQNICTGENAALPESQEFSIPDQLVEESATVSHRPDAVSSLPQSATTSSSPMLKKQNEEKG